MIILSEIQSFGSAGNSLAGVIEKFSALTVDWHNAMFNAKNLVIINFCTMLTVAAAAVNFFTKQHENPSLPVM